MHGFDHLLEHYGSLAVAIAILLEDFGMPTPGETLLIGGAIAASAGKINVFALLGFSWAGAVIGDNIGYGIGRTGGHRLIVHFGGRIGITEERLRDVEKFFDHYGGWVIVFARFVVILRQLNGIVAGTLGMHWLHFSLLNALGAALWVGFWGILAYTLGKGVLVYVHEFHAFRPLMIVIALAVLVGGLFYLWWRFVKRGIAG